MPSKKRKYEARFPPARIKKIMQVDEEIGKVAAAVPVIVSRAIELFLQSLVERTAELTRERSAKTLTSGHLKRCIEGVRQFDFLKEQVSSVPDIAANEEDDSSDAVKPKKQKPALAVKKRKPSQDSTRPVVKRKKTEDDDGEVSLENDCAIASPTLHMQPPSALFGAGTPNSPSEKCLPTSTNSTDLQMSSEVGPETFSTKNHLPPPLIPSNEVPDVSTNQIEKISTIDEPSLVSTCQLAVPPPLLANHELSLSPPAIPPPPSLMPDASTIAPPPSLIIGDSVMNTLPSSISFPKSLQGRHNDEDDDYDDI